VPTICVTCGRVLTPRTFPGSFICEPCRQKENPVSSPFPLNPEAPPPPPAEPPPPAPEPPPAAEVVDELEQAPPGTLARTAPQPVEVEQADVPLADLQRLWKLGQWLALTEGELTRQSQAAATMRWFLATDLDLPLSAALEISIIDGRPYFSARLLRILAIRHGYRIIPGPDAGDEVCTAILVDDSTGTELGQATYTIDNARRAGLADKRNYQRDPASMLWARAARRVLDYYAPNVLFALRLPSDPLRMAQAGNRFRDLELDSDPADGDDSIPF